MSTPRDVREVTNPSIMTSSINMTSRYNVTGNDILKGDVGAAVYIVVVLVVYGMAVVMLISSQIRKRQAKMIEDRQIDKYLKEYQVFKEKSSRDSYRKLKSAVAAKINRVHSPGAGSNISTRVVSSRMLLAPPSRAGSHTPRTMTRLGGARTPLGRLGASSARATPSIRSGHYGRGERWKNEIQGDKRFKIIPPTPTTSYHTSEAERLQCTCCEIPNKPVHPLCTCDPPHVYSTVPCRFIDQSQRVLQQHRIENYREIYEQDTQRERFHVFEEYETDSSDYMTPNYDEPYIYNDDLNQDIHQLGEEYHTAHIHSTNEMKDVSYSQPMKYENYYKKKPQRSQRGVMYEGRYSRGASRGCAAFIQTRSAVSANV